LRWALALSRRLRGFSVFRAPPSFPTPPVPPLSPILRVFRALPCFQRTEDKSERRVQLQIHGSFVLNFALVPSLLSSKDRFCALCRMRHTPGLSNTAGSGLSWGSPLRNRHLPLAHFSLFSSRPCGIARLTKVCFGLPNAAIVCSSPRAMPSEVEDFRRFFSPSSQILPSDFRCGFFFCGLVFCVFRYSHQVTEPSISCSFWLHFFSPFL